MKHVNTINAPTAHLSTFVPDLRQQMEQFGNARYREGFAHCERVLVDVAAWLTLDPPPPLAEVRDWLLAAHARECSTLPPAPPR